jgi:hypothetical protein
MKFDAFTPPYVITEGISDGGEDIGADIFIVEDAFGDVALTTHERQVAEAIVAALNAEETP